MEFRVFHFLLAFIYSLNKETNSYPKYALITPFFAFHSVMSIIQLLEVLLPLLKQLSLQKDVRPTLQERFDMAEWFQMHGFHVSG